MLAGQAGKEWPAAGVGAGQEKPPGLRRWQEGCPDGRLTEAWPQSAWGPAWPAAGSWCSAPLQRARETKQSLALKETQSGLFKEPRSDLDQCSPMLSCREGAPRSITYTSHCPSHARMLGSDRPINNVACIQQPPFLPGTGLH